MLIPLLFLLLSLFLHPTATSTATLQPLRPCPRPRPVSPTSSTIPAFPEQSALTSSSSSCPLTLPLHRPPPSLRPSCSPSSRRLHCCPALATLLFSSYPLRHPSSSNSTRAGGYNMPEVPEDTETCSEEVGKALRDSGVSVSYHNVSCDLVFCYCGIRLHRLSCDMDDGLFYNRVGLLARDCRSPGIAGCSKCLTSLYKLTSIGNDTAPLDSSNEEDRTTKMHDQDCQLMALSWLLAKNHSAYSPTVTAVFRAKMSTPDGSNPHSCALGNDGLPLAVDSSEISGNWSPRSAIVGNVFLPLICWFHILIIVI